MMIMMVVVMMMMIMMMIMHDDDDDDDDDDTSFTLRPSKCCIEPYRTAEATYQDTYRKCND